MKRRYTWIVHYRVIGKIRTWYRASLAVIMPSSFFQQSEIQTDHKLYKWQASLISWCTRVRGCRTGVANSAIRWLTSASTRQLVCLTTSPYMLSNFHKSFDSGSLAIFNIIHRKPIDRLLAGYWDEKTMRKPPHVLQSLRVRAPQKHTATCKSAYRLLALDVLLKNALRWFYT